MIDFEKSEGIREQERVLEKIAREEMRPASRRFDEEEHAIPWDFIRRMQDVMNSLGAGYLVPREAALDEKPDGPREAYVRMAHLIEMLSWGDAGLLLCLPCGGLGAAAVDAAGTPEQRKRYLPMLFGDEPVFTAMAMTEPGAGSDTSAIRATAVLDEKTNEWVLNGEKIYVTLGQKSLVDTKGYVVVWAKVAGLEGRAAMRAFIVPAGTPGCTVTKLEVKMGIRASDTASVVLEDCRVPADHLLGDPVGQEGGSSEGFKRAMVTFNVSRPLVSAIAIGVARAALEHVKEALAKEGVEIRYGLPRAKLTNVEREIVDMERMLRAAWLLVLKAVWLCDQERPAALESAVSKLYAGDVATKITQKTLEIMGPLGYSRDELLEKWFRDGKVNDIFEGTGQINRLIAARAILGFRGSELR
jgi:acyl-CoA dehydrogenase